MITIDARLVKELRELTGAGIMECKRALLKTNGNIHRAVQEMRNLGIEKATKKISREAKEGVIVISTSRRKGVILEVNAETDFSVRSESFKKFANHIVLSAIKSNVETFDEFLNLELSTGETVEEARVSLINKLNENICVRRFGVLKGKVIGDYIHSDRIGVIAVMTENSKEALAREIAMHIAALDPMVISQEQMPKEVTNQKKQVFLAQAQMSGKSDKVIKKIVEGKIYKFLNDNSLLGQNFVKDHNKKVFDILKEYNAGVVDFIRFEVGEDLKGNSLLKNYESH